MFLGKCKISHVSLITSHPHESLRQDKVNNLEIQLIWETKVISSQTVTLLGAEEMAHGLRTLTLVKKTQGQFPGPTSRVLYTLTQVYMQEKHKFM